MAAFEVATEDGRDEVLLVPATIGKPPLFVLLELLIQFAFPTLDDLH
jgi:hypothetical protein